MELLKRNDSLWIDKEALTTLELVKEGILSPVTGLMNKKESMEVTETGKYKGTTFPFPFILAPSGSTNQKVLLNAKKGETIDLRIKEELVGSIVVDEVFKIDKEERVQKIFGTHHISHPGVKETLNRLGEYAVCGEYNIELNKFGKLKNKIEKAKKRIGVDKATAVMIAAKPLHRAHERIIRGCIKPNELVVVFLSKPFKEGFLNYDMRYETVKHFVENYLPKNRVIIIPFETTYLFAGFNTVILDSIAAKNYGCDKIIIGQNHSGIGLYYEKDSAKAKNICDSFCNIDIDIKIIPEFVYCNQCTTLVRTNTCPHGGHHHITYHSESILELLKTGIIPPAVLMRKEISAMLLSQIFPYRFNNLFKLFADLVPNSGILGNHDDKEFYEELLKLYQTTSLT